MRTIGLEVGPLAARCVVVADDTTGEAIVVDPGFEADSVVARIHVEGVRPVALVLSHAHIDHCCGAATLKREFPEAPLLLHPNDVPLLHNMALQARMFGFPVPEVVVHNGLLVDGQRLRLGSGELLVRHCPGHSPGHIVLVCEEPDEPFAIVGDVLFAAGVGRTDLWGGSWEELERSIRTVLYRLPDRTRVIPGHGPETTIGEERMTNPFVPGE
jgi:hydroxyacylglutathione hydrolase